MHSRETIRAFIPGDAKLARIPAQNPRQARSAGNFTSSYGNWWLIQCGFENTTRVSSLRRSEILGKGFHVERRYGEIRAGQLGNPIFGRAHVLRADRRLIHASDDRGAARRADGRRREGAGEAWARVEKLNGIALKRLLLVDATDAGRFVRIHSRGMRLTQAFCKSLPESRLFSTVEPSAVG
jgi:hypothetical protein